MPTAPLPARRAPYGIETWLECGTAIAALHGDLDFLAVREMSALLTNIQHTAPRPDLMLLLTDLRFADSGTLGQLIASAKRAQARGGRIALVATPESFAKVIRISGLTELLPGFDTVEQAWAHFDEVAA